MSNEKNSFLVKSKKGYIAGVFETELKARRFANHMNKLSGPQAEFIVAPVRNEPSIAKNFTITREEAEIIVKAFGYYPNKPDLAVTLQKWLDDLAADECEETEANNG